MEKEYELHLELAEGQNNDFLTEILSFEKLIRLNPYWVIREIDSSEGKYSVKAEDHETNVPFSFSGKLLTEERQGVTISVDSLDWLEINLFKREGQLWATVQFEGEPTEMEEQKVVYWLRSVREYVRLYLTTNLWTKAHRYLMNKILLPMTPSQRKISLMLIRLSILEVVIILLIVVGYFYFN